MYARLGQDSRLRQDIPSAPATRVVAADNRLTGRVYFLRTGFGDDIRASCSRVPSVCFATGLHDELKAASSGGSDRADWGIDNSYCN